MKLHVGFDFWGAGNLGDDLMMAGFLTWLSEHAPETKVSALCAHDIEAMRLRFPSVEWHPASPEGRQAAMQGAAAWLGLGGSPFQSDLGPWLLDQMCANMEAAKAKGLPCFLVGVGLNNAEALQTEEARKAFALAEAVWFRDAYCSFRAQKAGHQPSKVRLGADLAHLYCARLPRGNKARGTFILHAPQACLSAPILEEALDLPGITDWTWLCQEVRPLQDSETLLHASLPEALRTRLAYSTLNYSQVTLAEAAAHLCSHGLVLSSRYHGSLAAAWAEARLAIFERNDKLTGLREELGAAHCRSLSSPGALRSALQEARTIPRSRLLECRDRADTMLRELFRCLRF